MVTIIYQRFDEDEYRSIEVESVAEALEYVNGNDSSWEWSELYTNDTLIYQFGE